VASGPTCKPEKARIATGLGTMTGLHAISRQSLHVPVLLKETLAYLHVQAEDIVLDGTIGFGGHSHPIHTLLNPKGLLLGLDQDKDAIAFCETFFSEARNVRLFHKNFSDFPSVLQSLSLPSVSKIFLDLGVSSHQIDSSTRGFSYLREESLDMRMNTSEAISAKAFLNTASEEELRRVFQTFGEIRKPDKLVANILFFRKKKSIETTSDLIQLIKSSFYFRNQRSLYIRACAQVFQAVRIEINNEFYHLARFLNHVPFYLITGGRIGIITFHSLEDRLVKRFFKSQPGFALCHKKAIKPTQEEIRRNPRSKSAVLRVFEKF